MFNLLLQVLDDGRLTDSQGRVVDFKNTIIIMTSNLGSDILLGNDKNKNDEVMRLVKNFFKPEFLNRIDEIVLFNPLEKTIQEKIVNKMLNELSEKLRKDDYIIEFSKDITTYIINKAFDISYGARPIKRFIQKEIETFIANKIISNELKIKEKYIISYLSNNLSLQKK